MLNEKDANANIKYNRFSTEFIPVKLANFACLRLCGVIIGPNLCNVQEMQIGGAPFHTLKY